MAKGIVLSVLAVLAGWAVVGVLVVTTDAVLNRLYPADYVMGRLPPDSLAALSLITSTLWSIGGGWVTARIAPSKTWHHILALIIWGEILGIVSAIVSWGQIQTWYQIGLLILWSPAVILGGWLRAGKPRLGTIDVT